MTHLLLISLGPVQDFIAAARRTRDLWFGSYVLSELSRAAAAALADDGAALVFPALQRGDRALRIWDGRETPAPPAVANKILATVTGDPAAAARRARAAVQGRWTKIATDARSNAGGLLADGIDDVWREQIDTLLEFSATWTPLSDNYATARESVEAALAGRKHLREFQPWRYDRAYAPKSSLDGARASVLRPAKHDPRSGVKERLRDAGIARKYRVPDAEQLDAVGVVKRCGAEPEQFVPISCIAARPWLDLAATRAPDELEAFRAAWVKATHPTRPARLGGFNADTSALLEDRVGIVLEELKVADTEREALTGQVNALLRAVGSGPCPYVACLVADGDRMGALLDAHPAIGDQQEVSRRLTAFAAIAEKIVRDHQGELVYAGGDDVLAFVPVATALAAADALRRAFVDLELPLPAGINMKHPTLSVGIAICHVLAGMGEILEAGRAAEKHAKGKQLPELQRGDALAVTLDKRSGGTYSWRSGWDGDPVAALADDVERLRSGRLSRKKPVQIEAIARSFPAKDDENSNAALRAEVCRALTRSNLGDGGVASSPAEVGLALDTQHPREAVLSWAIRQRIAVTLRLCTPETLP